MKLSKIIKKTIMYFWGNVLSKVIVFFLLPIYTKYIPAEGMGLYDTSVTIITLFSIMVFLDIGSGILKFKLEDKKDKGGIALTNGYAILMLSTGMYFLVLSIIGIFVDVVYYGWIVFYGFIYAFNTAIGSCVRALNRNVDYAVAGVLQTLLLALSNIVLLFVLKMDYSALFISFCLSSVISTLYMVIRSDLYRYIRKEYFQYNKFIEMFKFSLPLCVNSIAFWLLSSSSRVIVTYMLGTQATGYLSIANKFNQILYLASSCVQLTWQEEAYSHDNEDKNTNNYYSNAFISYYKIVMYCVVLMLPVIKIGLWVFPSFIADEYFASINMIPTALYGTGLAIVSLFMGTIFGALKKTYLIFFSTLIGAIVTITTNVLMIRCGRGPVSANYSLIFGYLSSIGIRVFLLKRIMKFSFKPINLLFIILTTVCTAFVYIKLSAFYNILWIFVLFTLIPIYLKKEIIIVIGRKG